MDEITQYHYRRVHLTQLPEDLQEMENRLKAAVPEMRFVSIPVCWRGGNPELIYLDSLLDNRAPEARLYGWIEPKGWRPKWGFPSDDSKEVLCMNVPEKAFLTSPLAGIRELFVKRPLRHRPHDLTLQRLQYLTHRILICWYRRDNRETKRFADKLLRLVVKETEKNAFLVDLATGLARTGCYKSHIWIGRHAAAWVRGSPDRFLENDARPGVEPESYRWELPLVGDLCMLKTAEAPSPKSDLLYDDSGAKRRVILFKDERDG